MDSLIHNPVKLIQHKWDSINKNWYIQTFIFLGKQPTEVEKAVKSNLKSKDIKILKDWFGSDWKAKLNILTKGGDTEEEFDKLPNLGITPEYFSNPLIENMNGQIEGDYQITMKRKQILK